MAKAVAQISIKVRGTKKLRAMMKQFVDDKELLEDLKRLLDGQPQVEVEDGESVNYLETLQGVVTRGDIFEKRAIAEREQRQHLEGKLLELESERRLLQDRCFALEITTYSLSRLLSEQRSERYKEARANERTASNWQAPKAPLVRAEVDVAFPKGVIPYDEFPPSPEALAVGAEAMRKRVPDGIKNPHRRRA